MTKFTLRAALLAAPLALSFATAAQAGGFYLQEQSVRGAGRAFSGEVADTGTASLWWNPASIGGTTGFSGHVGASAILPKGDVDNVSTLIVRPGQAPAAVGGNQSSSNPINKGLLPSGGIAYGLNDMVALGLVVTSPFSFTTNYEANSWARYTADKTFLRTADIQPSVAIHLTPGINLGAALNVEYSFATLSNSLPNLSPLLPDGHQGLRGDGWDVGFSLGAQVHEGPLSVGVSYKSSVKHKLKGSITTAGLLGPLAAQNTTIGTTASFRTPWQLMAGARLSITPQITLNAQVVRLGWNKFDAIRLGAPLNTALPENYRNTWNVAGGVDYALLPNVTLRAGIGYDQTPTQDRQRDARVPDSNRWNFTGGGSVGVLPGVTVDAAVGYIAFKDVAINRTTAAYAGTAAQTPVLVNGRLDNAHAVVLSLGGRFAF
jgi:long-chain fatty acid transport protein